MLRGTVLRFDNTFYEVLDNKKKAASNFKSNILLREIRLPNELSSISLKIIDKNNESKYKNYTSKIFDSKSNEYKFIDGDAIHDRDNFLNQTIKEPWPFTNYRVNYKALNKTKVDLRLSLNNILARIFLGKKYAKSLLDTLVNMRLDNGTTKGNKI